MFTKEEWQRAVDAVVEHVLEAVGMDGPPVDAFTVAEGLGGEVLVDRTQGVRGRQKRVLGRASIFVRPDPRPERLHWSVAHEVGEQVAYRVFGELGIPSDEVNPASRERAANGIAARLLMPTKWFADDALACGYDLFELKRRYGTVSHEAIALRLLDLPDPMLVTVFDHNRLSWRRSNVAGRAPRLHPEERGCQQHIHGTNQAQTVDAAALFIQGWPVHENGWKREILRTTAEYELDFGMENESDPWDEPGEAWETIAAPAESSLLQRRLKGPLGLVEAAQQIGDEQWLGEDRAGAALQQRRADAVPGEIGDRQHRHARLRGAVGAQLVDPPL